MKIKLKPNPLYTVHITGVGNLEPGWNEVTDEQVSLLTELGFKFEKRGKKRPVEDEDMGAVDAEDGGES